MKGDLFLFFPQWQGSGPTLELHASAFGLRETCPFVPFREVPVETRAMPALRHGILGYDHILEQQRRAHRVIGSADPHRIFSLGGDCGIEIGPVSWLNRKHEGKLAVIWLDAHGDLNRPEESPSQHFHGMPLHFLLEKEPHPLSDVCFSTLDPAQVVLAGTRELDEPERRHIESSGISVLGVAALEEDPALLRRQAGALGKLEMPNVYLHIDLDVLDPVEFPDVKCPAPRGLHLETLRAMIRSITKGCRLVGCSILEFVDRRHGVGAVVVRDLIDEIFEEWRRPSR